MSGALWSGPPVDSLAERAAGLDIVPTTAGRVLGATFGQGLADNPFNRLLRDTPSDAILGTDEASGGATETTMEPVEAQAKYPGIKVTQPVTDTMAAALYRAHHDEELRADILARSDGSLLASAPMRFAVSMAAGLLDPLNVAAGLVPVFGEARVAGMIARSAGVAGRAATRAGIGLAEGAVGMTALEPLQYGLDRFEGNDWTMGDALHRIAIGAAIGSVLHVGGGVVKDWWGRETPANSARAELLQRLEGLDPEARGEVFNASVAAVAEGRPVGVAPLVDFAEARADRPTRDARPLSLLEFLATRGGLRDEGGELAAMDLHLWHRDKPFMPKLVRGAAEDDAGPALPGMGRRAAPEGQGMSLDEAAKLAWENGYIGEGARGQVGDFLGERPDINALLDAIQRDAAGHHVYTQEAQIRMDERRAMLAAAERNDELVGARESVRMAADDAGVRLSAEETDHAARMVVLDQLHPEDAIFEATRATELDHLNQVRAMEQANASARDLRDAASTPYVDPADAQAARQATETLARAPRAEGPMDRQAAELAALFDATRAQVDGEVKAGRLTEADLASLRDAETRAANLEGDARASEEAAACMITRGGL